MAAWLKSARGVSLRFHLVKRSVEDRAAAGVQSFRPCGHCEAPRSDRWRRQQQRYTSISITTWPVEISAAIIAAWDSGLWRAWPKRCRRECLRSCPFARLASVRINACVQLVSRRNFTWRRLLVATTYRRAHRRRRNLGPLMAKIDNSPLDSRIARNSANAAFPAREASDIVLKKSDRWIGLLIPASQISQHHGLSSVPRSLTA
jgi:hypothetical protein